MLEELRIRGLGVIADATLDLAPGLTVLTGETGAGKTMVLQGLALVTGGRADSQLVRPGTDRAVVDARLALPPGDRAARLVEAGGELDEGILLLTRVVTAEGRSRAAAGGTAVPAGVLGELTDGLVTVHGQHDQQRLRRPEHQRAALDGFGGEPVARAVTAYRVVWDQLAASRRVLAAASGSARERAQEAELLRAGLERVASVAPQPGEDRELDVEIGRLGHAEALRTAAAAAHAALAGDGATDGAADVGTLVATARRELAAVAEHDPELASFGQRAAELGYLAADLAAELAGYVDSVEADPTRLEAAQLRRSALGGLARAWGPSTDDVLAWSVGAAERLALLEGADDRAGQAADDVRRLEAELGPLAASLTEARTVAAARFGDAVGAELRGLAMPHAQVTAALRPLPAPGPTGAEEVEILLQPHAGAPARALGKGASGGELSRVMLAVEVVLAETSEPGLLVFDEIDAGVGGRAAVEIGRRLAALARGHQVLVVTHLPQVAAFADRHLVVVKSDDGTVTESGVRHLDRAERIAELSRMLAGLEDSSAARAHAEELLELAVPA